MTGIQGFHFAQLSCHAPTRYSASRCGWHAAHLHGSCGHVGIEFYNFLLFLSIRAQPCGSVVISALCPQRGAWNIELLDPKHLPIPSVLLGHPHEPAVIFRIIRVGLTGHYGSGINRGLWSGKAWFWSGIHSYTVMVNSFVTSPGYVAIFPSSDIDQVCSIIEHYPDANLDCLIIWDGHMQ